MEDQPIKNPTQSDKQTEDERSLDASIDALIAECKREEIKAIINGRKLEKDDILVIWGGVDKPEFTILKSGMTTEDLAPCEIVSLLKEENLPYK